jgi:hypothetical protein
MNRVKQTACKSALLFAASVSMAPPLAADSDPAKDFLKLTDACVQETSLNFRNSRTLVEILDEAGFASPKQEEATRFARRSQPNKWKLAVFAFEEDPTAVPTPEVAIKRNLPQKLELHQEQVRKSIASGATYYQWQSGEKGLALRALGASGSSFPVGHSSSWFPACQISGISSAAANALIGNPRYEFSEKSYGQVHQYIADYTTVPAKLVMTYFLLTGKDTENDWVNARLELTRYPQDLADQAGTSPWHLAVYHIPET